MGKGHPVSSQVVPSGGVFGMKKPVFRDSYNQTSHEEVPFLLFDLCRYCIDYINSTRIAFWDYRGLNMFCPMKHGNPLLEGSFLAMGSSFLSRI